MPEEQKFPSEVIDLPSEGKVYPKDSPLSSGKIEIKYMTAKEEDILTSQNLIKKGIVIEKLLDSLILTEGVITDDLVVGDKNAVMIAARILAYGPEYNVEITHPTTGEKFEHLFNLADCPFKKIEGVNGNIFETELPVSKAKIKFKLLTGKEEKEIDKEIKSVQKIGSQVSPELTTRLKHIIVSINGDSKMSTIYNFVDSMLSRDSLYLRQELAKVSPDIDLSQDVDMGGETVKVAIPMTVDFFWPNTTT
tara:strand:+ start:559 stop:1308 length:750 start_codon:yes stop_codon:yes gene_type:complete